MKRMVLYPRFAAVELKGEIPWRLSPTVD